MAETALVIMARYPQAGTTKTRLARAIGSEETVHLYRAFLTDLAHTFARREYNLHWAYSPAWVDYQAFITTLAPSRAEYMTCFPQQGTDLGARLHHAFQWTRERGFGRTIVIGSDAPHMQREIIARAELALDEADVVLGPADDGGYYLIAMRQPYDVFSGIPMSTKEVARMTIEMAQRQGLTVQLTESLFDVDELPDLLRLEHVLRADRSLAPVTAAHLTTIKECILRSIYDDHTCNYAAALDLHRTDHSL